jgi:N-acetylmuramoyl-L-alanine amidase
MKTKLFLSFAVLLCLYSVSPAQQTKKESRAVKRQPRKVAVVAVPPLICIDPGHPSEVSSGGELQNGTSEVRIAWEVALKLREMLEERGLRVLLTKESESQLVENRERASIANRARAALMIRLHCDASADEGYAVYYPDRQGTTQGATGPAPRIIEASRRAAEAIHAGMLPALGDVLKDGGVRGDSKTLIGSQQGALTGSIFSEVPVVTIEMVVLSNAADAEFIKREEGQQQMARAIADGVAAFVQSTLASSPRGGKRQ